MSNGRNMRIVSMDESFMLIPTPKSDRGNHLENQGRVKVSTPIVFFITKWFNGFFVNWFNYIPNSIFLLLSGGSIAPTSPKPDLNESQSSQEVPIVMDESGQLPDPVEEVCIIAMISFGARVIDLKKCTSLSSFHATKTWKTKKNLYVIMRFSVFNVIFLVCYWGCSLAKYFLWVHWSIVW